MIYEIHKYDGSVILKNFHVLMQSNARYSVCHTIFLGKTNIDVTETTQQMFPHKSV